MDPQAKGSLLRTDVLGYCAKGTIAAAKNNVNSTALEGIARNWVDEYANEKFS